MSAPDDELIHARKALRRYRTLQRDRAASKKKVESLIRAHGRDAYDRLSRQIAEREGDPRALAALYFERSRIEYDLFRHLESELAEIDELEAELDLLGTRYSTAHIVRELIDLHQ